MTLLLSCFRQVIEQDRMVREGRWREGRPTLLKIPRLMGQTLGLVAFGHVARAVAKRARPFGLRVIAYDPFIEELTMVEHGVLPATLEEVLSQSDFVSMHAPATPEAEGWIARLTATHGPLMFHQSGGCCDGSAPMCYPEGDFRVGPQDVVLGEVAGVPFYIGAAQFEYWQHTQLIIDVVPGRGAGFSAEAPEGVRFLTRSRVFTDDEVAALEAAGPPRRAA